MSKIFATHKVRISGNKTKTATIALVLALTIAATLITYVPTVNAVLLEDRQTYAFVAVSPNPVGKGQDVLVTFGITDPLPSAAYGWEGLEVTVTDPNDVTETIATKKSESTGSTYTKYTPDETGTYYFQCSFPGMWLNFTGTEPITRRFGTWERWYKPSTSEKVALTVQQEPVGWPPSTPPPTDYWERPIYGENYEWSQIAGNWLEPAGGSDPAGFAAGWKNLYTDGPESSHIMWTKEIDFGGIVGGENLRGYYTGLSYERKFACIIMQGRLYYNIYLEPRRSNVPGFICVDLYTGEELWRNEEDGRIYFGQVLRFESPNQHGNIPYLWETVGSTYMMYNAFTGLKILDIENVTSGTRVTGPNGEILIYSLSGTDPATGFRTLTLWNSTRVAGQINYAYGETSARWRPPQGATLDGRTGIMWTKNVTSVPGDPTIAAIDPLAIDPDEGVGVIYCRTTLTDPMVAIHCAYDTTGKWLWTENRTGLLATVNFVNVGTIGEGIWTEYTKETREWYAFDVKTGKQKWKTDPYENAWGMFHACSLIAYGKFYTASYDGRIHCYDITDGTELWSYFSGSSGYETPYGHYPFMTFHDAFTIADGKVYAVTGEHSPNDPLYKGEKLHCINATDGRGIWNVSCWGLPPAVADGYAVTLNHYDNRIYCYGKGKTDTTVSVTPAVIEDGSRILIQGIVTDQSAAQPDTPCVSKEFMSGWMAYLHMQQPMPSSVTGVPVLLEAYGTDGSITEIGWVTSDTTGFKCEWTPPDEDLYTIMATFLGDESYGSSWTATGLSVGPAPPEEPEAPAYTTIDLVIIAVVVVTICLVIYTLYTVRKQRK